jgi:hypothetical protein
MQPIRRVRFLDFPALDSSTLLAHRVLALFDFAPRAFFQLDRPLLLLVCYQKY